MSWFKKRTRNVKKAKSFDEAERIHSYNQRLIREKRNKRIKNVMFENYRRTQHRPKTIVKYVNKPKRHRRSSDFDTFISFDKPGRWL